MRKEIASGLFAASLAMSSANVLPVEAQVSEDNIAEKSRVEASLYAMGRTYMDLNFLSSHPGRYAENQNLLTPNKAVVLPDDTTFIPHRLVIPSIDLDVGVVQIGTVIDDDGTLKWDVPNGSLGTPEGNGTLDKDKGWFWHHSFEDTEEGMLRDLPKINSGDEITAYGKTIDGTVIKRDYEVDEFIITAQDSTGFLYDELPSGATEAWIQTSVVHDKNGQLYPEEEWEALKAKSAVLMDVEKPGVYGLLFVGGEMTNQDVIEPETQTLLP